jgi:Zn-dependent protease
MPICRYCGEDVRFWNIDLFTCACPTCKRTGRGGILNTNMSRPDPSAADLHFSLFGIPVRISVWFWIIHVPIGLLIAWKTGPAYFFIYVSAVAISVLVHELGHVMVGMAFGARGQIVLTAVGGLAGGCNDLYHRWKRIVVYSAGPGAQLAFAGLLSLACTFMVPAGSNGPEPYIRVDRVLTILLWVNVVMAVGNLLPFPPLDGGQIMRELFQGLAARKTAPWERDPDWWKRGLHDAGWQPGNNYHENNPRMRRWALLVLGMVSILVGAWLALELSDRIHPRTAAELMQEFRKDGSRALDKYKYRTVTFKGMVKRPPWAKTLVQHDGGKDALIYIATGNPGEWIFCDIQFTDRVRDLEEGDQCIVTGVVYHFENEGKLFLTRGTVRKVE